MAKRLRATNPAQLLAELVAIPSVNLGPQYADPLRTEEGVTAYLEHLLRRMGFATRRQPVRAGRSNMVARLEGRDRRHTLLLQAHMDTVGVEGMRVRPFVLTRKGGKLYGRGACDTKGSMASFLAGVARLLAAGKRPNWDVVFVGTMGEETGCEGSTALAKSGFRADAGLIGEPTRLRLCVAHKSALWWKAEFEGRTAHGSLPHMGISAVQCAAAVARVLAQKGNSLARVHAHPLLSPPTLQVGVLQGGEKVNVVPARAAMQIDSRLLPGESTTAYLRRAYVLARSTLRREKLKGKLRMRAMVSAPGFAVAPQTRFPRLLRETIRTIAKQPAGETFGGTFFSDAGPLSHCVPELVVFGPGDIAQAHTPEEYVESEQLELAAQVVYQLLQRL